MLRKLLGRFIEWLISYDHEVIVDSETTFDENGNPVVYPRSSYIDDAGYDLFVYKTIRIPPHSVANVRSGVMFDPKDRLWFEIKARSSTFRKRGLEIQDAVIDRGYRGEMFAICYNPTDTMVVVASGERICQVVPHRLIPCTFSWGTLSKSHRDKGGFGSSGK